MSSSRALVIGLLWLAGCGKNADYLHYVRGTGGPRAFDATYKVKELQGESRGDILWVIDNSRSMGSYQQAVVANTGAFMQGFVQRASIDWKMGLISTDEADDPYLGFALPFDSHTPSPVGVFQGAVQSLGVLGSGYEMMYDPAVKALTQHPGFLRSGAALIFLIVTDAHEQSRKTDTAAFLSFLARLKGDLQHVYSYGILGPQDWGCPDTDMDPWNYAGSRYEAFVQATHGKTFKLCDPNFSQNLAVVGQDIGRRIAQPRLFLQGRPRTASLHVYHRGRELPGGRAEEGGYWIYDFDQNAVVFHNLDFAPGDDEQVRVVYDADT